MLSESLFQPTIRAVFVCHDVGIGLDVFFDGFFESLPGDFIFPVHRTDVSAALDQRHNRRFIRVSRPMLANASFSADIGFVHLDCPLELA